MAIEEVTIKVKDSVYTMPRENLFLLARTKARDAGNPQTFETESEAVEFLQSLGIVIEIHGGNYFSSLAD